MRTKIKNILFILSTAFVITFVLVEVINLVSYNDKIYLEDSKEHLDLLSDYKDKINNLEDDSCKSSLETFVKRYEKTSYKGEVSLKDIYDELAYTDSYPAIYQEIRSNCGISENDVKEYGLVYGILDSMITYEEFFNNNRFPYEFHLYDTLTRDIVEPALNSYRYGKIKRSELSFIQ